jgi:hypothetical protein
MKIQLKIKDQTIPIKVGGIKVVDNYDKGYEDGYNASYDIGYKDGETNGYNSAVSKLDEIEITENGEYIPSEDRLGYSKVTVNVSKDITLPVFTGDLSYQFYQDKWSWFIEEYGDKITTQDGIGCKQMFYNSKKFVEIPFEINCKEDTTCDCSQMFYGCNSLRNVPKINNCKPKSISEMFYGCFYMRYLPEDIESWFDWSYIESNDSGGFIRAMFQNCYSLRQLPTNICTHGFPKTTYSYSFYNYMASNCYCLDEIIDLPIPYTSEWKSNAFNSTFSHCYRLKNITFATPNGQPYVVNWKGQTIDLTYYVGVAYHKNISNILNYNSGITEETRIIDDETYQLYKDNPDSWTIIEAYSRYNHDSAVATINSLPDTSAYLLANGGTNTIKFKGASGSKTDGGAINTLTEEEIAVATAKGWTVTFA